MGKLILVRHGETDLNRDKKFFGWLDPSLNELGREQALSARRKIDKLLKREENIKIYTSPLRRALETCEILETCEMFEVSKIADGESYTKKIVQELKEINFGIFEGFSYEEILEKYPHESKIAFTEWEEYNFQTGESPRELQKRTVSFIENQLDLRGTNVIVSHWGVINSILSYFFSKDLESYWKFSLKNGGIAIISFNEGFPVLEGFNIGAWDE